MTSRRSTRGRGRVLVTGTEHPGGLAALRALDRAGFEAWAAVESRASLGARSRAAAGLVVVPSPRTAPETFVAALADAAASLSAAAVLPGTEAALLAMAGRDEAFPASVALGSVPEAVLRRATDKTELPLLARRAGLDAPRTSLVGPEGLRSGDEPSFPAIVKPLRSEVEVDGVVRRFESRRVESASAMERAVRSLPDGVGLVQPAIEGRLIAVNGVAFQGEVYGANQSLIHRVWPDRCGAAVHAETIPMTPARERAVAELMGELAWNGIFNLQLIERDGRDHVIDLNPRFYVSLQLAVDAGLNLPAIWTALLLGLPFDARGYRAGVHFREEKGDPRAILVELSRGHLAAARDLLPRRRTAHALFSIRDPGPSLSVVGDGMAALRRRSRDDRRVAA